MDSVFTHTTPRHHSARLSTFFTTQPQKPLDPMSAALRWHEVIPHDSRWEDMWPGKSPCTRSGPFVRESYSLCTHCAQAGGTRKNQYSGDGRSFLKMFKG